MTAAEINFCTESYFYPSFSVVITKNAYVYITHVKRSKHLTNISLVDGALGDYLGAAVLRPSLSYYFHFGLLLNDEAYVVHFIT